MAQLEERLFPIPEVCGSNPVISKIYIEHLLSTVLKRSYTEMMIIKKKEAENGQFF